MTSCSECLTELRTVRLAEIRADSPVALHYATCQNCRSVAEDLFYAENRLANALAEVRPYSMPETLAAQASEGASLVRRRKIAGWLRRGLLAVGAVLLVVAWEMMRDEPSTPQRVFTETMTLECITPTQAQELATAYLRSDGSAIYISEELRTITLRGRPDDVASAKRHIEDIDASDRCASAPVIVGEPAKAPAGK